MYLEGISLRSIAKVLGVSNIAVLKWIRNTAKGTELLLEPEKDGEASVMKLSDIQHLVYKKNAKSRSGWLLIELPKTSWGTKQVVAITKRD